MYVCVVTKVKVLEILLFALCW